VSGNVAFSVRSGQEAHIWQHQPKIKLSRPELRYARDLTGRLHILPPGPPGQLLDDFGLSQGVSNASLKLA
jgi:hypothetical protein